VFRSFLNEAGLMSLVGAALGLAASPFVYGLLRRSLVADVGSTPLAGWVYLAIGGFAAFVFSLAFGVWPARQAARIDASLAIRTE
jgi:ABC-type antimicrobial peptide transport system permease subunit